MSAVEILPLPPGWSQLHGPGLDVVAELGPADPRMPFLRLVVEQGDLEALAAMIGPTSRFAFAAVSWQGAGQALVFDAGVVEIDAGGATRYLAARAPGRWARDELGTVRQVRLGTRYAVPAAQEARESTPAPPAAPAAAPDLRATGPAAPDLPSSAAAAPVLPSSPAAAPDLHAAGRSVPAGPPAARLSIIDRVPWRTTGAAPPTTGTPPAQPAPAPAPLASDPPRQPPRQSPPQPAPGAPTGAPPQPALSAPTGAPPQPDPACRPGPGVPEDLDVTVDRAALRGLAPPAVPAVSVLAVLCPAGHVSPPHASHCRSCGREVPRQEPFSTARPPLGVLRLSTGDVVTLDRAVVLGRAPTVDPALPAAQQPNVVKVPSPQRDVSRAHMEILLDGWHVLVRDLGTTNGTTVALPGRPPQRLRAHDLQVIEPGTVVSLADEVTVTFEASP